MKSPTEVRMLRADYLSDRWHEERKRLITASDAAKILGLCPWKGASPLDVWARKKSEIEHDDPEEGGRLEAGLIFEPAVMQWWTDKTGIQVVTTDAGRLYVADDWLGATPDGLIEPCEEYPDGAVYEGKCVSPHGAEHWADGKVPDWYYPQAQVLMYVLDKPVCCFGAALGSQQLLRPVVFRDEEWLDENIPLLKVWWQEYIEGDDMPEARHDDVNLLGKLHPEDTGEIRAVDDETIDVADTWQRLGAEIRELQKERDGFKAEILRRANGATMLVGDGRTVTIKWRERGGFTVAPTKFQVVTVKDSGEEDNHGE